MANTERFKTLQFVVAARKAVGEFRSKPGLSDSDRKLVEDTFDTLIDLEDTLILSDLRESVESLRKHRQELVDIVAKMEKQAKELSDIAKTIDRASQAIGALAEIGAKASSAGIL